MARIGLAVIPSEHDHPAPAGHPENLPRLAGALAELEKAEFRKITAPVPEREYATSMLAAVHDPDYLEMLATIDRSDWVYLDPDTYATANSFAASCRVTWALLSAVDEAMSGGPVGAFVLGRPPGHHACRRRAMGFCLVNHIAVAAQYALDRHHLKRIAIVDFDIHHGNGTQDFFYERSDVLYVSVHQYPFYPGTGAAMETGSGAGEGYTRNFPFPGGTGDTEIQEVFERDIAAALHVYRPDLILVSAGFDGHSADPLGGFRMTGPGYAAIARILRTSAEQHCGGRLISILEGGYNAEGNLDAITRYIKALSES